MGIGLAQLGRYLIPALAFAPLFESTTAAGGGRVVASMIGPAASAAACKGLDFAKPNALSIVNPRWNAAKSLGGLADGAALYPAVMSLFASAVGL